MTAETDQLLLCGRRYGLLGPNGCGKSSLLKALGKREVGIPEHIDTYLLDREIEASDLTALEAVMKVDDEKIRLEKEAEQLLTVSQDDPEAQARLEDVYERYDTCFGTRPVDYRCSKAGNPTTCLLSQARQFGCSNNRSPGSQAAAWFGL